MKILIVIASILAAVVFLGLLGLQIQPKSFLAYAERTPAFKTMPLHKILWITRNIPGKNIEGTPLSAIGSATWLDQGKPWAVFTLEDIVYNVEVSEYIHQKGP